MSQKLRKILVLVFSVLFLVSGTFTVAMADGENEGEGNVKFSTFDEFLLGGWIQLYDTNIKSYDQQVVDLAKAGMNLIDLPLSLSGGSVTNSPEFWQMLDTVAQQVNMNYFYCDPQDRLNSDKLIAAAKDLANCIGYELKDEPSAAQMDALAESFLEFFQKDQTRFPFVNLYPNYAGATNLGGTYRDYVTKWVTEVGAENLEYLYFDHYPFTQTESVRSSYFSDLEVIRDVAYTNGRIKTGGFTQMGSWNGMTRPTADMARWSMNSLLAYGLKSLSHFCWVAPKYVAPENGGEGMRDFVTDWQGNPTDLYEPVSIYNWQTRQIGEILMQFDVKHAYHTAAVPTGAEGLTSSFILQPGTQGDDFIYSIGYSKDDSDVYLMVFNKALQGEAKDYTINVDLSTGVESLTYYQVTDFAYENLPDPTDLSTMPALNEVKVDVSGGSFTQSFKPGELKVYKINGENVQIYEDLEVPTATVKSGIYVGEQKVTLSTGDVGTKLYYTLDGSFPEPGANGTKLYEGPFTVGKDGEFAGYNLRAVSVRGKDVSGLLDVDLYITDASRNVAQGVIGKFMSMDMSKEIAFSGFNGSPTNIKNLTDGSLNPTGSVLSTNELGWAVLDLGATYEVDRILFSSWHDWWFGGVQLQIATKADFSDATTVFSADSMQNNASGGTTVYFNPTDVRYVRFTNNAKGEGKSTIVTDLQVYTRYEGGTDIIADTASWSEIAGGKFTNDGSTIVEGEKYQTSNWDKAYSYNARKYKNFMLEATMSIDVGDPGAWGYAGFQIYRTSTETKQSDVNQGLVVGIEPRGRALIWNGGKELGALDANVAGWSVGSDFTLRIIAYKDIIAVQVNGQPVMYEQNPDFNRAAGYISLHTGLLPVTVSSLTITDIDGVFNFPVKGEAVNNVSETKIAVERYVSEADVIAGLGNTVKVTDTAGKVFTVGVEWESVNYDRSKTGMFDFVGTLSSADLAKYNLSNAYSMQAFGKVFVKSEIDASVIGGLLDLAKSLSEVEYTAESWEYLQLKVQAAEAILADPFMVQSDVNVGMFQLYDAIYDYLVFTADTSALEKAIADAEAVDGTQYMQATYDVMMQVVAEAKEFMASTFKTYAQVLDYAEAIALAKKNLVQLEGDVSLDAEAPVLTRIPVCAGSASGAAIAIVVAAAAVVAARKRKD